MSPASQGALEVERYIGSCLISSSVRPGSHKSITGKKREPPIRGKSRGCFGGQSYGVNGGEQCQVQYGHSGWTGSPLISMSLSPRRCNQGLSPLLGQQQQTAQHQHPSSEQVQQMPPVHLQKSPLSRLAIHTQGAPLILAGKFPNRGKLFNNTNAGSVTNTACGTNSVNNYAVHNSSTVSAMNGDVSNEARCAPSRAQKPTEPVKKQQVNSKADCPGGKESTGTSIANIDSLSIASDESSGSNNSENGLPRIIKPRKRRKKDRKPPNNEASAIELAKPEEQQLLSPGLATKQQASIVPTCYEQRFEGAPAHLRNHRRPPLRRESVYGCRMSAAGAALQEIADIRQRNAYRHVEVKVVDDNRNVVVAPVRAVSAKAFRHNPHHISNNNNNPRYQHEYNGTVCKEMIKNDLRSCQCHYCDPSALIWDGEQNCYTQYLTPSSPSNEFCSNHLSQIPVYPLYIQYVRPTMPCQEQDVERHCDLENSRHQQERNMNSTGVALRRSWSDPTSYFSEEISVPNKDVGVIGDRGQPESGNRRTLWRGDTIDIPTVKLAANNTASSVSQASSKGLEVSTEIITSPNGHRDLEIKFYSPSPSVTACEDDKGIFGEEVDEDEEDFSDIWSYHESKLQQDFRTLLQAEE